MPRSVKSSKTESNEPKLNRIMIVNKVDNTPVVTLVKVDKDHYVINHIDSRYVIKMEVTDGKNTHREALITGNII